MDYKRYRDKWFVKLKKLKLKTPSTKPRSSILGFNTLGFCCTMLIYRES